MSFHLTNDQMAALFGANWQTLTRGAITDADPKSIVGKAIAAHGTIGAWRTAYLTLFQYASDTATDMSTGATLTFANPDVDPSTWLWLQGAADANAGIGYFAGVIRDYTAAQYKARTGSTLDQDKIYQASADVAQNVFSELLPQNSGDDASSFGIVPNIFTIASKDAGAIANDIFGGDYTPWSGALLFPYLGVGGIYEKLVLKAQQNKFPGEGDISQVVTSQKDTYDLVSILQAFPPLAPGLLDALSTALTLPQTEAENRLSLDGTIQLLKTLGTDTDTYLNGFYSLGASDAFNVGSRLFPANPVDQASFFLNGLGIHAAVGTLGVPQDQVEKGTISVNNTDRNLVNAGPGDDTVVVNNTQMPPALNPDNPSQPTGTGTSVLDGGLGTNTLRYNVDKSISYTATYEHLTPDSTVDQAPSSRIRIVGHSAQAPDTTDLAYRFQNLALGAGGDTFSVGSGVGQSDFLDGDGNPTLTSVDGGDGKNTLDLRKFGDPLGATIHAPDNGSTTAPYAVSISGLAGNASVAAYNFHTLKLGSGDDTVSVQDGTNLSALKIVDGGAGDNTIQAGDGDKTIYYGGSYGSNTLYGADTYDEKSISRLVGGPSAEDIKFHQDNPDLPSLGEASASDFTISSGSGSAIMVGGAGKNDFLIGNNGRQVIWGGGGSSTYEFSGYGAGVFVAHMDNPTAEKVANLDFSLFDSLPQPRPEGTGAALGWTVIIDPGADDKVTVSGKTVSAITSPGFNDNYEVIDNPNTSPSLTFSENKRYDTSDGKLGWDEYYGYYEPGDYTYRGLSLIGFSDGDFGIKDLLPGFSSWTNWYNGQPTYRDPNNVEQDKADPQAEDPGFNSAEIASIQSTMQDNFAQYKAGWQPIHGTPVTIHEANADGDTLTPDGPGDTLISGGKEVSYGIAASDGAVTVDNYSLSNTGTSGQVRFDSSVSAAAIGVGADAAGDIRLTNTATGNVVTITHALSDADYAIGGVSFADNSSLSQAQLAALALVGSPANTSLYGFSGADTFDSRGFARFAQGAGGADTFVYNPGYGALSISELTSDYSTRLVADTLQLGAGITVGMLSEALVGGDVVLADGVAGDAITLSNMVSNPNAGVQNLAFEDGTVWDRAQILGLAMRSTTGADQMFGTPDAETFDGQGAPAGSQDYAQGSGGADTFVFNPGYGQLEVNEDAGYYNASTATLQFGAGIAAADVSVAGSQNGSVLLTDGVAGDQVKIDGMLTPTYGNYPQYGVAQVAFADGSTLSRQQILALATTGTTGADTLYGTAGADTLDGKGAPSGAQDYEQGSGGSDTFVFGPGYGQLEVNEDAGYYYYNSAATLQFGAGIAAAAVSVAEDQDGSALLTDGVAGDQVKVDGMLTANWAGYTQYGAAQIQFADGTTWSRAQVAALAGMGTTGSDVISGTLGNDVLDGRGGGDTISGGGGYDTHLMRQGYGTLTIDNSVPDGAAAQGEVDFGPGITEQNLWFSQSGDDLTVSVMGSADAVDVKGWFGTNPSAQLAGFKAFDGLRLDGQVGQLTEAMAAYAASTPGFDPATATAMPTDPALRSALATAWHS